MKPKTLIALLLTFLFIGKVVSIDAKAYTLLLENQGISLVNQYCEYGGFTDDDTTQQNLNDASAGNHLQIDFLCHTPVQLAVSGWQSLPDLQNFKKHGYLTPQIPQVHKDRFYPPPRL